MNLPLDSLFETFLYEELDELRSCFYLKYDIPRKKIHGKYLNKLKAAFYCGVTDYSLKDISRKIDVSYGLLRKWNCVDELFKKIKNNAPRRFVDWYYFRLRTQDIINVIR